VDGLAGDVADRGAVVLALRALPLQDGPALRGRARRDLGGEQRRA
jgi:hypothetical protein